MNRKYVSTEKIIVNNKIEDLYQELVSSAVFFPQISKKEKDKVQPEMFHSNLPNISDIINSKKNVIPGQVKEALIKLTDYSRQLENLVRLKNKEIERMQFYNNFLAISAQKKEELLESERKELNYLKDELSKLQAQFNVRRKDNRSSNSSTIVLLQPPSPKWSNNYSSQQQMPIYSQPSKILTEVPTLQDDTNTYQSNNISPKRDILPTTVSNSSNNNNRSSVYLNMPPNLQSPQITSQPSPNYTPQKRQLFSELNATSLIPMNSYLAGDNQTDTLKTPTIINLNLSDEEALEAYNTNDSIDYLHKLIKDENKFIEFVRKGSNGTLSILYEKIRKTLQNSKVYFLLLIRLKKIIRATFKMTTGLALSDALETIVDETCICMECDRCTVFVLDEHKNELWSKTAKGTKSVIRMPANHGIAGFVATTKQTLNILNAYADERFNKEVDKKSGYKTKTILCVPIVDDHDRVVGVIQCINKLSGHFTKDDEALMMMISDFSRIIIKNAVNFDDQNLEQYKLRTLVNNSVIQTQMKNIDQIVMDSERKLRNSMNIDDARIVFNNMNNTMSYFNENLEKITVPHNLGIVGQVLTTGETINCFNCYNHILFSPEVDISTSMPVLCIPLLHPRSKDPLGVIQVINVKGIGSFYSSEKPKIFPLDQEVLHYFVKQLSATLLTRLEWFEGVKFLQVPNENQSPDQSRPGSSYLVEQAENQKATN